MKKNIIRLILAAAVVALGFAQTACTGKSKTDSETKAKVDSVHPRIIIAYVTSGSDVMPDPNSMTHINYAFGHVNQTFNGIDVANPDRLHQISALKQQNPDLKVILSVGGWGSGRFSEMAADSLNRASFAADAKRVIDEFNLDGIDIDWEYPTSSRAGISSSPDDTQNYTLLMRDLRSAIGPDKLLTLATPGNARFYDFPAILHYIDFVNIMSYDIGQAKAHKHQAPLYESEHTRLTADQALKAHLEAGIPKDKLTLGLPFYGRGAYEYPDYMDYKDFKLLDSCTIVWDEKAQVPYVANSKGELVMGYNDPRAIEIKCKYILDNDLLGAMYWEYTCDDAQGTLRKIVTDYMMGQKGLDYQQAPAEHYVPTDTTAPAPKPAPAIPAN